MHKHSYIIGGALNSGKGMIPRILKDMERSSLGEANPQISLQDITSIDGVFDTITYTDNQRADYYNTLTDEEKIKFFPKFHLAKMFRLPVAEIMEKLGGEYGWNQTELYESDLLFQNVISSYLRSLSTDKANLSIGIGNTPEGVRQFLDEVQNPDIFSAFFVVKTKVGDILERLNQDKLDSNHQNSWPLRLPEGQLYKAANLIALHGLSVAERADKLGFQVIDTSIGSDEKLLAISREIFKKQKENQ